MGGIPVLRQLARSVAFATKAAIAASTRQQRGEEPASSPWTIKDLSLLDLTSRAVSRPGPIGEPGEALGAILKVTGLFALGRS